jgi:hypothetical protein
MPTISEYLAQYKERQMAKAQTGKVCAICGRLLQETITGSRSTDDGSVCSDCYYDQVGDVIEQHPIVSARAIRG